MDVGKEYCVIAKNQKEAMDIIKKEVFDGRPNDDDMRDLRKFGYQRYDQEQSIFVMTKDGVLNMLSTYNAVKRYANQLEKEKKSSIPLRVLGREAIRALKRDASEKKNFFLMMESLIAAWSESNDGAGQEVLDMMDKAYEEEMSKLEAKQERRWLLEHQGKQVSVDGNYEDTSNTSEHHYHR